MCTGGERETREASVYEQIQATEDFADLRRRLRRFVFPMTVLFLLWYLAYVLLASFAKDFMSTRFPADSNLTVGLYIGLLQFVTTFAITTIYVRYANNHLDPVAERLRIEIEGSDR